METYIIKHISIFFSRWFLIVYWIRLYEGFNNSMRTTISYNLNIAITMIFDLEKSIQIKWIIILSIMYVIK